MPRREGGAARRPKLDVDEATSKRLGRVRQHGTAAEIAVRRLFNALGIRYRLRNRDLPGSPDLANRSRKLAVFVHGCFWHAHEGCARATLPKRNREFWREKLSANVARDARVTGELKALGYEVVVIWECDLRDQASLLERLRRTLPHLAANRPS